MSLLLDLPAAPLVAGISPDPAGGERALLESLARSADAPELRHQALIELMGLAVASGDELGFERLRHELAQTALAPAVECLFRARVAWGLAHFGRTAAARRWMQETGVPAGSSEVRDWLLEFDRRVDPATL